MVKGQSADRSEIARTLQRLILFAAALVAVVLLALGAAHLPSLRNRALAYAQDYASRELGIQLRASGLAYSLLDGSVELRDVSLSAPSSDQPFLHADRAAVVFDRAIFLGRVNVMRVSLTRPLLTIVRARDGTLNLPRSTASSSTTRRDAVRLGTISLTAFSARLEDREAGRSVTLGPVDLSVDTAATPVQPGTFGPSAFTARIGDAQIAGTIGGGLSFDGTRVRLDRLTANTKEGRVTVDGWADVMSEPANVSSQVTAEIDLAQAARLARADTRGITGRLTARLGISGPAATPAMSVKATLASSAGSLDVDGTVDVASRGPKGNRLGVRWTKIDIDQLARAFSDRVPVRINSFATGSGTIEFEVSDLTSRTWENLSGDATTALGPGADTTGPDILGLSGTADMHVDQGRWSLRHTLRLPGQNAELVGEIAGRLLRTASAAGSTLGGRLRLRTADIGRVPPLLVAAGARLPADVTDGLHGSVNTTIDLAGTTERPRARIDLGVRTLRVTRLPQVADVHALLDADMTGFRAREIQATAGSSSLRASGRSSWRGVVDGRFEWIAGNLFEIASHAGVPIAMTGSATVAGVVRGDVRALQTEVTATTRDLTIEQVPIGALTATGTLDLSDGGVMKIDATAPAAGARATLQIVNRAGYPASGEISIAHDEITRLVPPRYREQIGDTSGRVKAIARGSGQLSDLTTVRGRVEVAALDLMWRGSRFALASPGSLAVTADGLTADNVSLLIGQQTRATLSGQLGTAESDRSLQIRLEGPLSELMDIGARSTNTAPAGVEAEGMATLDLTVRGTVAHPLPRGSLIIRSPAVAYGSLAAVTDVSLEASIEPTIITLRSIAARWQGATLIGAGALPWRVVLNAQPTRFSEWLRALPTEPGRAELTLRADHVTQSVLNGLVAPGRLHDVEGDASATITLEANHLALDGVRGAAVLDRASLTLNGVTFNQEVPTRLALNNGRARIEEFRWRASDYSVVASGGISLLTTPALVDLGFTGVLDLRLLGAFVSGARPAGRADTTFTVKGPLSDPEIAGRVHLSDAELQWDSPRFAASDVEGVIEIGSSRKVSIAVVGLVNTGAATLDGTLDIGASAAPTGSLQFTGRGVILEYPSGFQTESNADLEFELGAERSTLKGRIDVLGGAYREPLVLSTQLRSLASADAVATGRAPEWMSRIDLNIAVGTTSDVRIDNNYGRLDVGAALRVTGTPQSPGLVGRLEAADNGEIYFGGNTYRIERLAIDFANPRAIAPDVTFSAQTRIGDLPIGIDLRCPPNRPCERKVISLASNVDDKEAEARLLGTAGTTAAAGETLARLVSGELLGVVSRTVGLDALRLEQGSERRDIFDDPTLISGDVNPAARLTLAKRVGPNVELVFSQNLADDGFTWSTSYFWRYGMSARLLILDDQSRAYEFRHEPPIGGSRPRRQPPAPAPRIAAVRIVGAAGFPEDQLRRQLRLREGDRFAFSAWQGDRDRLERFYHSRSLLEARVRARRLVGESPDQDIVLEYAMTRGPDTNLEIRGVRLPDIIRDRVSDRWATALFDGFLEADARTIVRDYLFREGYLQADVTASISTDSSRNVKTLTIDVAQGPIVPGHVEITGTSRLSAGPLLDVVHNTDPLGPWLNPSAVTQLLVSRCRSEGFLDATVSVAAPVNRHGRSVVVIAVNEGAPYSIGAIQLSGLPAEMPSGAGEALGLSAGERYRPATVEESARQLETRLRGAAYREASVQTETRAEPATAQVDVALRVIPGSRSILRDVIVEGADASKPIVARSIVMAVGAPLDATTLAETRRRLYDLDIYRSVDVEVRPLQADGAPAPQEGEQPVAARIVVQERPRYRLRYGLAVNDDVTGRDEREQHLGVAADLENRNIFGLGANAKLSLRLRQDQQIGRFTVGARRFFGLPIRSTVFVERAREQLHSDAAFPTTSSISTFTGEQAYRVRKAIELRYGYSIERNHTFIRSEETDPFDLTVNIARFIISGLVDKRDDAFNPARGWFLASTLESSAPGLGSDLRFLKYFAQVSDFIPLTRGMVVASAVRLGMAHTAADEVLIPSERFYAGGANSVRGYREDDLGARGILGDAEGGSALLVVNGELRFPVFKRLRGVGFLDAGNAYPGVSEISVRRLQVGAGGGARLDTPFGLIRFDVGLPVNRRPSDPRWRFHFGLGHAF